MFTRTCRWNKCNLSTLLRHQMSDHELPTSRSLQVLNVRRKWSNQIFARLGFKTLWSRSRPRMMPNQRPSIIELSSSMVFQSTCALRRSSNISAKARELWLVLNCPKKTLSWETWDANWHNSRTTRRRSKLRLNGKGLLWPCKINQLSSNKQKLIKLTRKELKLIQMQVN